MPKGEGGAGGLYNHTPEPQGRHSPGQRRTKHRRGRDGPLAGQQVGPAHTQAALSERRGRQVEGREDRATGLGNRQGRGRSRTST